MANLSTLTPHSSLVFEEDNSSDTENGTSDEIDGEKKDGQTIENTNQKHHAAVGRKELGMFVLCGVMNYLYLIEWISSRKNPKYYTKTKK